MTRNFAAHFDITLRIDSILPSTSTLHSKKVFADKIKATASSGRQADFLASGSNSHDFHELLHMHTSSVDTCEPRIHIFTPFWSEKATWILVKLVTRNKNEIEKVHRKQPSLRPEMQRLSFSERKVQFRSHRMEHQVNLVNDDRSGTEHCNCFRHKFQLFLLAVIILDNVPFVLGTSRCSADKSILITKPPVRRRIDVLRLARAKNAFLHDIIVHPCTFFR
mmetsp:Transcript_28399/g.85053  ORF Transcript_28399/g.85053 Transcript_28399/m.85053 type:complete len:221 (+) Transcript_28399:10828-11490(+)